jgi:pimeloyl-ACP methyl ester carboxylesterase
MIRLLRRRARYVKSRYRARFPKRVPEEDVPISIDMGSPSSTLLIAFGGMRGRIGMPPFEFLKLTGEIPVKRLFVRDLRQAWYHEGLPPNGRGLLDVADDLRGLIAADDVQRLVVTGNSAGGYAALVFGTLLGADTVLCFAPQTILDLDELAAMDDHRWDESLRRVTATGSLDPAWVDLRSALPRALNGKTRYGVFFDDTLRQDRLHAERLEGIEGLRLYRFGRGSHHLVRSLRDSGALARLLREAVSGTREGLRDTAGEAS